MCFDNIAFVNDFESVAQRVCVISCCVYLSLCDSFCFDAISWWNRLLEMVWDRFQMCGVGGQKSSGWTRQIKRYCCAENVQICIEDQWQTANNMRMNLLVTSIRLFCFRLKMPFCEKLLISFGSVNIQWFISFAIFSGHLLDIDRKLFWMTHQIQHRK